MIVEIKPVAEQELEEIGQFIALDNPVRAASFVQEILEKAYDIGNKPYMFAPLIGYRNIRKRSFKGYIILYEIVDETIQILHVLNSYRNYISLLNKT